MRQIYDFEGKKPPALNENMIRTKLERRKRNQQVAMLMIGEVLLLLAVIVLGGIMFAEYPQITMGCVSYVIISVISAAIFAILYCKNYGSNQKRQVDVRKYDDRKYDDR